MASFRVFLTGFNAFDGEDINPASLLGQELAQEGLDGLEIDFLALPTCFSQSQEILFQHLDEQERPYQAIVCLGQAGGREALSLERIAINCDDARIPDNAGQAPIDQPVVVGGPAAYFASLPIKAMVQAMQEAGVPAYVSNTAGTYVCNHIMYAALHYCAQHWPACRAGFIHFPFLPQQVVDKPGKASMSLETMLSGLRAALTILPQTDQDLSLPGGTEH